jgi:hypothetical protein
MNARERKLALVLLGVLVVIAVVFLAYQLYWSPMTDAQDAIVRLETDLANRQLDIDRAEMRVRQLNKWRKLSLPRDVNFSWLEYEQFLTKLVKNANFADTLVNPQGQPDTRGPALKNKQPIYTRLTYTINGRATLGNIVSFLEQFHKVPLLHRVKSLQITRFSTGADHEPDELRVAMTVEALVLDGAQKRTKLEPDANVQKEVLAKATRNYESIASKNIFLGPTRVADGQREKFDLLPFVKLTDISYHDGTWEASLYNPATDARVRHLRAERGFNRIFILDEQSDVAFTGKVERIDNQRELYFSENGKYFRFHVGQTLADALGGERRRKALSEQEVKDLGLGAPPKKDAKDVSKK